MRVAVTSLPVPLSPVISTVLSLLPITRRNSNTARIRALRPTTTESIVRAAGVMGSSNQAQRFELRNLLAERRLDAEIEGHVRARAAGAHAGQFHVRGIAFDGNELDVAAVRLDARADAIEHRLNAFSRHHAVVKG